MTAEQILLSLWFLVLGIWLGYGIARWKHWRKP